MIEAVGYITLWVLGLVIPLYGMVFIPWTRDGLSSLAIGITASKAYAVVYVIVSLIVAVIT